MIRRFFASLCVFLTACSSAAALSEQDSGKTFIACVGEKQLISLPKNPTTGYSWQFFITPEKQQVVSDIKETYIAPDTTLVGAGGVKEYAFTVCQKGKITITGYYIRPWEKTNKENARKVTYTFDVVEQSFLCQ